MGSPFHRREMSKRRARVVNSFSFIRITDEQFFADSGKRMPNNQRELDRSQLDVEICSLED